MATRTRVCLDAAFYDRAIVYPLDEARLGYAIVAHMTERLCLPPEVPHWNISTLRRALWWVPGEWAKHRPTSILWLLAKYLTKQLFAKIQSAASQLEPLI